MSTRKVQVLKCKCGAKYAACVEPDCYEDTEWLKDLGKCLKEGGTVEMESAEEFRFTSCTCKYDPTLFLMLADNEQGLGHGAGFEPAHTF